MEEQHRSTPRATLPLAIGIAVLALYLVTLNQWVSVRSLTTVAKVTGWDWSPIVSAPLFYLLTWPFRWLPSGMQLVALNVFSAFCAAASVALLARSVQLLPHDRTHDQRLRERSEFSLLTIKHAWIPPVLACLAFAAELTMWEHATAATGESLDVLLLAVVIWCLLEYRISLNERWLTSMAFIYGLAVTNNWAMIGLFPFALGSLIWIKGLGFFNSRFILKLIGAGVAGLVLYLFLPAVWLLQNDPTLSFWDVLRSTLAQQKMYLADTPALRVRALVLGLVSILPVIIMGIRWPTTVGDTSRAGAVLTHFFFRVIHFVFFAACLAMALNLKFSPRELGGGLPFLSFYYLGALAVGYYSGYILLVHRPAPKKHIRRDSASEKLLYPLAHALVWAALIAVPGYLLYKNVPQMMANNGRILRELVARAASKLPAQPAAVLSDDGFQLLAFEAHSASSPETPRHAWVNTKLLPFPSYQEKLVKRWPSIWPKPEEEVPQGSSYSPFTLAAQVYGLSSSNQAWYLHPSFGYFFESNFQVPRGLVYQLKPFPEGALFAPPPMEEVIAENEKFWADLQPLVRETLNRRAAIEAAYTGTLLSRSLNHWGRELNRAGRAERALEAFGLAYELNTNNIPAGVNYEFAQLSSGKKPATELAKTTEFYGGELYRTLDGLLLQCGPYDHPSRTYAVGQEFLAQGLGRQAAAAFRRAVQLDPAHYDARLALAGSYLQLRQPDLALEAAAALKAEPVAATNRLKLATIQASAFAMKKDLAKAEETLLDHHRSNPRNLSALALLTEIYRNSGEPDKALQTIERQIAIRPEDIGLRFQRAELLRNAGRNDEARAELDTILKADPANVLAVLQHALISIQTKDYARAMKETEKALDLKPRHPQALAYKGVIHFHQGQYNAAVEVFDEILERNEHDIAALRNRALTHLKSNRLEKAREDYEQLLRMMPHSSAVHFGLAEVAYQQKRPEAAVYHYERYLKLLPSEGLTPEMAAEKQQVEQRLRELKGS